jgi:hypothetical protein
MGLGSILGIWFFGSLAIIFGSLIIEKALKALAGRI